MWTWGGDGYTWEIGTDIYTLLLLLLLLLLSRFSRVQLCDSLDGSPPGSPVPGILQARTLEWVAISFSRGFSPGIEPQSLALIGRFFTTESPGNFLVSFGRFIPWYFILFVAMVNGIDYLISLSSV